MRWVLGIFSVLILILAGYWWLAARSENPSDKKDQESMERVEFLTQDDIKIVGDYYAPEGGRHITNGESRGVLLVHMMPADRKSWTSFAEKLQKKGFPVLALDLRGHGESEGGPRGYKNFSDAEHQTSKLDVLEGAKFLRSKRVDAFHLVGASIGANLALQYAAEHPNARSAVLLSPGLDYRGITTEELMGHLRQNQAAYLVASEEDTYSRDSVNRLAEKISLDERHKLKIFTDAGHGTAIFEKKPEFMDEIIEWLLGL